MKLSMQSGLHSAALPCTALRLAPSFCINFTLCTLGTCHHIYAGKSRQVDVTPAVLAPCLLRIMLGVLHACCLQRPCISNTGKRLLLNAMPGSALLVPAG